MKRRSRLALLHEFATTPPDRAPVAEVEGMAPATLARFLSEADAERVLLPVGTALARAGLSHLLTGARKNRFDHLRRTRQALAGESKLLAETARSAEIPLRFLKGFRLERARRQLVVRQITDLDVAVPDIDSFWRLAHLLAQRSFRLEQFTLRCDRATGVVSGVACFFQDRHADRSSPPTIEVEVQIAAQPLSWSTARQFQPWHVETGRTRCQKTLSEDAASEDAASEGLEIGDADLGEDRPATEDFLILAGEMLERRRILVRDVVDLQALAAGAQPAAEDLAAALRLDALEGSYARVVHAARRLVIDPAQLPSASTSAPSTVSRIAPLLAHEIAWHRRRASGDGLRRACAWRLRTAVAKLSRGPRSGRAVLAIQRRLGAASLFASGILVPLVRVASSPADEMRWWQTRAGDDLLVTPLGLFAAAPLGVAAGLGPPPPAAAAA